MKPDVVSIEGRKLSLLTQVENNVCKEGYVYMPLLNFSKTTIFHVILFLKIIKLIKLGLPNKMCVPFRPLCANSIAPLLLLILSSLLSCFTFVPSFLLAVTI